MGVELDHQEAEEGTVEEDWVEKAEDWVDTEDSEEKEARRRTRCCRTFWATVEQSGTFLSCLVFRRLLRRNAFLRRPS